MTSLRGLYDAAVAGTDLVVTAPHYQWLERLESEQIPSQAALVHVVRALLRQYKHPRLGRFSPSSMGKCARRVVFDWAGPPQLAPDPELIEMADHGTLAHLKWQIEGLTMGYMQQAEVWVEDADMMTGGSMDGQLVDDSLFELKTVAPGVYTKVVLDARAPRYENLLQLGTYFILADKDRASVVYEDRAYGNFHEFRVERNDKIEQEVLRRLASYRRYVEDDVLPPQLTECELKMGQTFKACPYRGMCHTVSTVSDARALHDGVDSGLMVPLGQALPPWATRMLELAAQLEKEEHTA